MLCTQGIGSTSKGSNLTLEVDQIHYKQEIGATSWDWFQPYMGSIHSTMKLPRSIPNNHGIGSNDPWIDP